MNDVTEELTDALLPLVASCAPLKVTVKLKRIKDRYYIHFDGSTSYGMDSGLYWENFWLGFDHYVKHVLRMNGFDDSNVKLAKSRDKAVAFVGTLFGFLIREPKGK